MTNALTTTEQNTYTQLESVIHNGLQSFIDVGNALSAIRDGKLYRDEFGTFEDYCRDRWGFNDDFARKQIRAAGLLDNLKTDTMVSVLPTSERQARPLTRLEPEQQREAWQTAVETAPNGKVTAAHVQTVVNELHAPPMPHVSHNSGNNEWYTPEEYITAARSVMGTIDLDPATSEAANEVVKASAIYTIDDNGLNQDWYGKVWLNPPYAGDLIGQFATKLIADYVSGNVEEATVLVNNATETGWFQSIAEHASAVCFPARRVKFWKPNGDSGAPLQGQAVLYLGDDTHLFVKAFNQIGLVCLISNSN